MLLLLLPIAQALLPTDGGMGPGVATVSLDAEHNDLAAGEEEVEIEEEDDGRFDTAEGCCAATTLDAGDGNERVEVNEGDSEVSTDCEDDVDDVDTSDEGHEVEVEAEGMVAGATQLAVAADETVSAALLAVCES